MSTGKEKFRWETGPNDPVLSLALAADGKTVYTGESSLVRAWETATGKLLYTGRGHTGGVFGVAASPDGRTLATASTDGSVKIWDAASLQDVLTLPVGQSQVKCVAFAPDGRTLAGIGTDGKLRIWR